MAVAVKNASEEEPGAWSAPLESLPAASLAGGLYVLGSFWLVFYGITGLWWHYLFTEPEFRILGLLLATMIAAGVGLTVLGFRLLGPEPQHGLRGGIGVVSIGLLVIGAITWLTGSILQGLDVVMQCAALLRNKTEIVFVLVGDGVERERLQQKAHD